MRALRAVVLVLLAAAATPVRAAEDLVVERPAEGYRVARPGPEWTVRELPAPESAWHALKLVRAPAPSEVSVTVYLGDAPAGATAARLCAASAARWRTRAAGAVTENALALPAGDAASLTCDVRAGEALVRVRQTYVVHDGDVLLAQCQAPPAAWSEHEAAFDAVLASFAFLPGGAAREDGRRIRALAARCGADVPRATTWSTASARAAKERRLVLVVCEAYRGLPVPGRLADTTTFADDDVAALCAERFVVLPWRDGLRAPFDAPETYGLGPHTFGQGVLFVTPAGRVVGGLGLLEPSLVDEAARAALAATPEATGAAFDPDDAGAALRRGDLDRAAALLAKPDTADAWLLRAALLRRLRRGDDALAALDEAAKLGADAAAVEVERGVVRLRTGRIDAALAAFGRAGDVPAARYWRAVTRAVREGVPGVRADLVALATSEPETRWSCRAAAILVGRGVATGVEAVVWPDAATRAAAEPRAASPEVAREAAIEGALAHLLATQRHDGTWPVPMAFTPDPRAPTTAAVTAIAGTALLRRRGDAAVDAAVDRALDAVLAARDRVNGTRRIGVFDYGVWGQVFSLRFLAAYAKAGGERDVLGIAASYVAALGRSQQPSGGWSYANLEDAGAAADNSIGFVTAAAVLALLDAREAGVAVPDEMLARAAGAVASLRRDDGTWNYQTATPGLSPPTEAALRGPLCALALARAGAAKDPRDVERAVAALVAQAPAAFREAGKPLCHTAPDGVSAYYLLYGCRYAADAVRDVAPDTAAAARDAVVAHVLRVRRDDGSFCDFPPIGPAYGTAMALETLDLLRPAAR